MTRLGGAAPPEGDPDGEPRDARKATELEQAVAAEAVAKERARSERLRAEEAEQARDAAKSGSLMSFGLTIGDALAVQYPAWETRGARQVNVKVVNMPYVLFLPSYWGKPQARREYCASAWSGGDEDSATSAAMGIARKTARQTARAITVALKAGLGVNTIHVEYLAHRPRADAIRVITLLRATLDDPGSNHAREAERDAIEQLAHWDWNPTYRGRCFWLQFGVWLGLPFEYDARVRLPSGSAQETVEPQFAFGLAFSPHAYFSLLAGLTVSDVRESDPAARDTGLDETIWTGSVGIGGNLDLLGVVTK